MDRFVVMKYRDLFLCRTGKDVKWVHDLADADILNLEDAKFYAECYTNCEIVAVNVSISFQE